MKRKIGLALATGLALLVAGCASQSSSGEKFPAGPGQTGSEATRNVSVSETSKNFNLAVKCPGVHYLKKHGLSDQQIMQQENVEQEDIPACEQWVQAQPKGYVPPPPAGGHPAPAGGAPPPGTAKQ